MCGRATGRRGELRLAKLSLAVSDSFLPERRKREEQRRRKGERRTRRALRDALADPSSSRSSRLRILRSVKSPQISSFSSSCTQPALRLIACSSVLLLAPAPLLRTFPLPVFPLYISSPLSSASSLVLAGRKLAVADRNERARRTRGPRIDLMRIIPALIAEAHGE